MNVVALGTVSKDETVVTDDTSDEVITAGIWNIITLSYRPEPIFCEVLYLLIN